MKKINMVKRIATLLLAITMICGLFVGVSFAAELPKTIIRIEAENPTEKYVDMENRTDVNGNPMDHSVRQLAEDGLQYVGQDAINFAAFDWYTYTFNVETAGVYKLSVRAASDRNSPFNYKLDGADTWTSASMTSNGHAFDVQVLVASMELTAGQHTITFTNTINKNHNAYTDYWRMLSCLRPSVLRLKSPLIRSWTWKIAALRITPPVIWRKMVCSMIPTA